VMARVGGVAPGTTGSNSATSITGTPRWTHRQGRPPGRGTGADRPLRRRHRRLRPVAEVRVNVTAGSGRHAREHEAELRGRLRRGADILEHGGGDAFFMNQMRTA